MSCSLVDYKEPSGLFKAEMKCFFLVIIIKGDIISVHLAIKTTRCQLIPARELITIYLQIDEMSMAVIVQIEDVLFSGPGSITPPVSTEDVNETWGYLPLKTYSLGLQMIVDG